MSSPQSHLIAVLLFAIFLRRPLRNAPAMAT
jgi:hypothetical protein